jgi:hypothetical protein
MNTTNKHVSERVLIYAILWCICYIGSLFAIKTLSLSIAVNTLLTLISVLAFSVFIYKYYRSIFFMDEVQIKMQMEAVVFAFSMGLLLISTLGLLDLYIKLNANDWNYRFLVPIFILFYFIGLIIAKRKYRFNDEEYN